MGRFGQIISSSTLVTALYGLAVFCTPAVASDSGANTNEWGLKALSNSLGDNVHISGYMNFHIMQHDGAPELVGKNINEPLAGC